MRASKTLGRSLTSSAPRQQAAALQVEGELVEGIGLARLRGRLGHREAPGADAEMIDELSPAFWRSSAFLRDSRGPSSVPSRSARRGLSASAGSRTEEEKICAIRLLGGPRGRARRHRPRGLGPGRRRGDGLGRQHHGHRGLQLSDVLPVLLQRQPAGARRPRRPRGHGEQALLPRQPRLQDQQGPPRRHPLDGAKFWVATDLGDDFGDGELDWAVLYFDKTLTPAQREAIGVGGGPPLPRQVEVVQDGGSDDRQVAVRQGRRPRAARRRQDGGGEAPAASRA